MVGFILCLVFLVVGFRSWFDKDMYLAMQMFSLSAAFYLTWRIASFETVIKDIFKKKGEKDESKCV